MSLERPYDPGVRSVGSTLGFVVVLVVAALAWVLFGPWGCIAVCAVGGTAFSLRGMLLGRRAREGRRAGS